MIPQKNGQRKRPKDGKASKRPEQSKALRPGLARASKVW